MRPILQKHVTAGVDPGINRQRWIEERAKYRLEPQCTGNALPYGDLVAQHSAGHQQCRRGSEEGSAAVRHGFVQKRMHT